jgi:hypothetical protein
MKYWYAAPVIATANLLPTVAYDTLRRDFGYALRMSRVNGVLRH